MLRNLVFSHNKLVIYLMLFWLYCLAQNVTCICVIYCVKIRVRFRKSYGAVYRSTATKITLCVCVFAVHVLISCQGLIPHILCFSILQYENKIFTEFWEHICKVLNVQACNAFLVCLCYCISGILIAKVDTMNKIHL